MSTPEEIVQMILDCMERESKLSEWEAEFVQSIDEQLGRGQSLTRAQDDKLVSIWERIT